MEDSKQGEEILEQMQKISRRKESLELNRILVGVSGGSASGKTTICQNIKKEMSFNGDIDVLIISLDCFYKPLGHDVDTANYDFDSPNALDFELAYQILQQLIEGQEVQVPRYNFKTHSREEIWDVVKPTDIILFEGILALYDENIRNLMSYQIFMHTDDDIRLCRRIIRDVNERGRSVEGILYQYNRFVKNSFDIYIKPTMNYADIIVPGRDKNHVSVQFIVDYLKTKAIQMGIFRKVVQRDMLYIGDMVDGNMFQTKEDQEKYLKVFITPNHEDDKKELQSNISIMKDNQFNKSLLQFIFKNFIVTALHLWRKLCLVENYDMQHMQILNLKHLIDNINTDETFKNPNKHIIIIVPVLNSKESVLDTIFTKFSEHSPNSQIVFITIFADLKILKKYNQDHDNIKKLINVYLIGNKMKLYETLKENSKDVEVDKFYDILFFSQTLYKTASQNWNKWMTEQESEDSETLD